MASRLEGLRLGRGVGAFWLLPGCEGEGGCGWLQNQPEAKKVRFFPGRQQRWGEQAALAAQKAGVSSTGRRTQEAGGGGSCV